MIDSKDRNTLPTTIRSRLYEAVLILVSAVSLFLLLSMISYHAYDPGWSHTGVGMHSSIANWEGKAGAVTSDFLFYFFGIVAYVIPVLLFHIVWEIYRRNRLEIANGAILLCRLAGFFMILSASCALIDLYLHLGYLPSSSGGILGHCLGQWAYHFSGSVGSLLLLIGLWLTGVTLLTSVRWSKVIVKLFQFIRNRFAIISAKLVVYKEKSRAEVYEQLPKKEITVSKVHGSVGTTDSMQPVTREETIVDVVKDGNMSVEQLVLLPERQVSLAEREHINSYSLEKSGSDETFVLESRKKIAKKQIKMPPITLLDAVAKTNRKGYDKQKLYTIAREVELRLKDFNIIAKVVAAHPGPVITRFEIQLSAGTKVSKITALAKDLARSLSVSSVRIVEIIPGKSVIGLELPNANRDVVKLRDSIASKAYHHAISPLSLALGLDIAGYAMVVNLGKMPHLLVAGTTGSGKSVGLNAMLLSLLYKSSPEQLRLILIDPKMLELSVYENIPHLLTPVVTDMKDAVSALRWCVAEMDRRYQIMSSVKVRNLANYNKKIRQAGLKGEFLNNPFAEKIGGGAHNVEALTELPHIVVIVDEFADMVMLVGKKIEDLIARIAQKARAAGIHLILATQRPSVDVITGLIKANIPARIAFQVSSKIDSRTILDQGGAEQLLGQGDMLYLSAGSGMPIRLHGAYVSDEEVHRVATYLREQGTPDYLDDITKFSEEDGQPSRSDENLENDPFYDRAVAWVTESRRVSVSSIQRRFKIGYNRAACIVEAMETAGVVTPMSSNGSREVLAPAPVKYGD